MIWAKPLGFSALFVVAGNENEQLVGQLDQRMELSMSPSQWAQAQAAGVPYSAVVPLSGPARPVNGVSDTTLISHRPIRRSCRVVLPAVREISTDVE